MARKFISFLLLLVLTSAGLSAQHIQGLASFASTPNGPQAITFTLNNADSVDSGTGTIDKVNGNIVNLSISWSRDVDGVVTIYYQDVEQLWLANCTQGIPQNHGGTAILNDTGPSNGSWSRSN
ncbi:MAG: hypothetical protein JNM84_26305 [Planctomycetes bacterium]|nr:hypothetical protein [Planctomycetota bacterium]